MTKRFQSWEDKFFWWTLCISLSIHVIVVGYLYIKQFNLLSRRKQIEVFYEKSKPVPKKEEKKKEIEQEVQMIKKEPVSKQIEILSKKQDSLPDFLDSKNTIGKMDTPMKIGKKENPILKTASMEREISIPILESGKISNPSYLKYNDGIRAKIKSTAYQFINNPDFTSGEVYLTFIVLADGTLKEVQILESRTRANEYLREVGIKSIKEAQPFPPFPKSLNYPELTFNIVISFQVNQ